MCGVYGPKEANPRHLADATQAVIKCRYMMAPFSSLSEHGRSGPNRRATEISKVVKEVFENVVMTKEYPGSQIEVYIEILQGDGGTRVAGVTAAAVALATSGIPMKDLPYAVSVGRIGDHMTIDFNMIEDNYSDSDMPMAIAPRNNEILLLQMDGDLTKEQMVEGIQMGIDAGKQITEVQRNALKAPTRQQRSDTMATMGAMDIVKANHIRSDARSGSREDGRGAYDFRSIKVTAGMLQNAEGSAQVR